jgi:hypothetical protein
MDPSGAGDMDPCECVWSHELATRRIINMVRQTQDYCTDNECFTETPGAQGPNAGGNDGNMAMFFIGLWFMIALVLYFMRPRTSLPPSKARGSDDAGPSHDPPAPGVF